LFRNLSVSTLGGFFFVLPIKAILLAVYGPFKVQHLQTVKNKIINASYVARSYLASRVFGDRSYDSDPFFFVHIPKTAGTTFLRVLYQSEPHALICPNAYEHFIDNQGKYLGHQELMKDPNFLASVKQRKWIDINADRARLTSAHLEQLDLRQCIKSPRR
jgi:hypothetical protein